VFARKDGLSWLDSAGRAHARPMSELKEWVGQRSQSGRIAPNGFPKSNKFGPAF
jgi:topoisomerase-4 subunit A